MPPLMRMRRAPCRRASSASVWPWAESGCDAAAPAMSAPAPCKTRRREVLILEILDPSMALPPRWFCYHHHPGGMPQQGADVPGLASGLHWNADVKNKGETTPMAYPMRLYQA